MHKIFKVISVLAMLPALHACTWVKPTPEGGKVVVSDSAGISKCVAKGELTSALKSRVGGFERNATKVEGELETLASNEAVLMGGDTIVAKSDILDGRQTFAVYKCRPIDSRAD